MNRRNHSETTAIGIAGISDMRSPSVVLARSISGSCYHNTIGSSPYSLPQPTCGLVRVCRLNMFDVRLMYLDQLSDRVSLTVSQMLHKCYRNVTQMLQAAPLLSPRSHGLHGPWCWSCHCWGLVPGRSSRCSTAARRPRPWEAMGDEKKNNTDNWNNWHNWTTFILSTVATVDFCSLVKLL